MTQPIRSDHSLAPGGQFNCEPGSPSTKANAASPQSPVAMLGQSLNSGLGRRLPTRRFVWFLVVTACLCFLAGAWLSLVSLPAGFDYRACVISRLCSRFYNPAGCQYLALGMSAMAILLLPVPSWLSSRFVGCRRLGAWGVRTMQLGLVATIAVVVERAWCPTHWHSLELVHLTFAGTAFLGLWLGMAMLVGAAGVPGTPRVRWRWLCRPPFYLMACALPIFVVFGMYVPLNIVPEARGRLFAALPRTLVFLRTVTFWQWYLVFGLLFSLGATVGRACRLERRFGLTLGTWRLDPAQSQTPHQHDSAESATLIKTRESSHRKATASGSVTFGQ